MDADRTSTQSTVGQRALTPPPPYSTTAISKRASKSRYRLQGRYPVDVQRELSGRFMHMGGCGEKAHEPLIGIEVNGEVINSVQASGGAAATVRPCGP